MHFKTLFLNNNRFSIISSGLFDVIAMITLITYASLQLWRENGCFRYTQWSIKDIHGIQVLNKLVNVLRSFCFDAENHLFFIIKMTRFHWLPYGLTVSACSHCIFLSDLDLSSCCLSWNYIGTTQLLIVVDRCVVLASIGTPEALDDCQLCQTEWYWIITSVWDV